ncbi:aspartyl-phosphate phosphatase Spo0E family protein [Niallia endozanthoxylica]|uniref:Aspartyl-phosphate phosphatase Spo0E family protein n=1 Tax=Niallia endozanthoxylica TaxID=2036016 RepID=A0A5J5HQM6_9BACI|nr:aspartyl-phosphate phosphatase Spo0E family protein [Niallia endozanthoxylica]KAA9021747.1 aspartyl-phosphate phosphatase Spo0E family protein [Niallia endozanthoxylica]
MSTIYSQEAIESMIEIHRKALIETGLKHGFNSAKTLTASQKLDKLILQYQKQNR